eukprot:scaffold69638_cov56-Phaeocystis_antarctica.AAC.1
MRASAPRHAGMQACRHVGSGQRGGGQCHARLVDEALPESLRVTRREACVVHLRGGEGMHRVRREAPAARRDGERGERGERGEMARGARGARG